MKKKIKIILIVIVMIIILIISFNPYTNKRITNTKLTTNGSKIISTGSRYIPLRNSREELYQDTFVTLLSPYIQKEVDKYYNEYSTSSLNIAPYDVVILSEERVGGYRGFNFRLKFEVHPYIGPHNYIGTDYITLIVTSSNSVKIEKFEHVNNSKSSPGY